MVVERQEEAVVKSAENDVPSGQVVVEELLVGFRVGFFVRYGLFLNVLDLVVEEDGVQFAPPEGKVGALGVETPSRFKFGE